MAVSKTVPVPSGVNAPSGTEEVELSEELPPDDVLPPDVPPELSAWPVFVPALELFPELLLPELPE